MDERTLAAYDGAPARYCDEWLGQPSPEDIHALWRRFFAVDGESADIGSGSGRDVDWLNRNGYPCVGFEASGGLLAESRLRFPHYRFVQAALPDLAGVVAGSFRNVVCETVLMHLPIAEVRPAVRALTGLLAPGGTLYLSWRVTDATDIRDAAGRLYCAFAVQMVREQLSDLELLYDIEELSHSSGRRVHRLIARRP